MHRAALLALTLLFVALVPHQPRATTVRPVAQTCPVCRTDFVAMALTSYSYFGSRERDLGDMPFAMFRSVTVCPHCLHAALDPHFESGTPALKPVLEKLPAHLDGLRVKKLADSEHFLQLLIAQACTAGRETSLREQAELQMHRYYAAKRENDAALLAEERARLLTVLQKALDGSAFAGSDVALFTYLRGELLRLAGEEIPALKEFDRARELVKKLPAPDGGDTAWIAVWAEEQSQRIRYAKKPVAELEALCAEPGSARTAALIVLSERRDPAAWAVIRKHVDRQPERLVELDDRIKLTRESLRLDPEFWNWGAAQFRAAKQAEGTADNTLEMTRFRNRFAHLFDDARNTWTPKEEHARQLAAALDAQTAEEKTAKQPVFPKDWDERTTLRHLPLAIQSGSAAAVDFFLRWAESAGDARVDDFSYEIKTVFSALPPEPARNVALARMRLTEPDAGPYGRRVLNAALCVLAAHPEAPGRLLQLLREKDALSAHWELAARAFNIAGIPVLKAELLPLMKGGVQFAFSETYTRFGTDEDIPALEAFITAIPLRKADAAGKDEDEDVDEERVFGTALHERYALEQMLLHLKLKKLVAECAKGK